MIKRLEQNNSYKSYTKQTLNASQCKTADYQENYYKINLPPYFCGSTMIRTDSEVKPVFNVQVEDFLRAAYDKENMVIQRFSIVKVETDYSSQISKITVMNESLVQTSFSCPSSQPFFTPSGMLVSPCPPLSLSLLQLQCRQLREGDYLLAKTKEGQGRQQEPMDLTINRKQNK